MSDNMSDIKKIIMAGVGAVSVAAEKSQAWIEEMAKKGEEATKDAQPVLDDLAKKGADAFEKGKVITSDLKAKLQRAFDECADGAQQMDLDSMKQSLHGLTDDALEQLKQQLDDVLQSRKSEPQPQDEQQADGEE